MKRTKKPETLLHEAILKALKSVPGIMAERQHVGVARFGDRVVRFGPKGWLDFRVIFDGGGYGEWEVKMPAEIENLSEQQRARMDHLKAHGIPTGVICNVSAGVATVLGAQRRFRELASAKAALEQCEKIAREYATWLGNPAEQIANSISALAGKEARQWRALR